MVMEFRTYNCLIWLLGILNVSRWRKVIMAGAGKTFWPSLKWVIKPSCEQCPCYIQRKRASLSLKTEELKESSEGIGLVTLAHFATLTSSSSLLSWALFWDFPLFTKPLMKLPRFNHLFGLYFPMNVPVSCKTLKLNRFVCFSLVNVFCYKTPTENA